MKTRLIFLLIAMLTAFAGPARADEGKLYTSDKMSSSAISCVVQDAYGFIWIGTEYGLNRFDGYQFVKYFRDARDSTSLQSNEITAFFVDSREQLWIGCRKGLMRYNYATDSFCSFPFPDADMHRVVSLTEDAAGDLVVGTSGYGLYVLPRGGHSIVRADKYERSVVDGFVSSLFLDDKKRVWCGNLSSVLTCIGPDRDAKGTSAKKTYNTGCGPAVSFVRQDHRGFFVVCMYGILYYDYQHNTLTPSGYDLSVLEGSVSIRDAFFDRTGNLYVATSGMGLMIVPKGQSRLQRISNVFSSFDISTANANKIIEDRTGNLWVACYKKGLFQLLHNQNAFSSWRFSLQNYALGSSVSSIAMAQDGDVLCVVQKAGIYRFGTDGKIERRLKSPDSPIMLYRDHHSRYWLGTEKSLYDYNPDTEKATLKLHTEGLGITSFTDDGNETLFFSSDGKGLYIYNTATGAAECFSMGDEEGKQGRLVNNWIRALYYDSRGLLWIGSVNGLGCMNPRDRSFKPLGWDVQLRGTKCYSLFEMPDGNMLIGTESGLYLYDRSSGEFAPYAAAAEVAGKAIYSIAADKAGDLWMSTPNGILHLDTKSNTFNSFVYGDGLDAHEYVVGAQIVSPDGRIFMGNNDGITAFYPPQVKDGPVKMGQVYLTNFMVNGERKDCRSRSFEIDYSDRVLLMEFAMLDFQKTDLTTFQYRINGNTDWTDLPEGTHSISFNELKPGTYHFEVQALLNGSLSEEPCQLTVVVRSPWYQSWWACLCYALIALLLVSQLLLYYYRRQKRELEEAKMQFLINATHDIRSPLTLIIDPLKKVKEITDRLGSDNDRAEVEGYWDIINRNAQRLLLLLSQILDERKIDKGQMQLHCEETDMVQFIQSAWTPYRYHAHQRSISFVFDHADKALPVWIDRVNFEKVLTNLLSNAIKYTFDGGEIRFVLSQRDGKAVIQLLDTGIGFKNENTERLFERFYQGENARGVTTEGSGIGLNLSRSIVELHGGTISACNRGDGQHGACIEVQLPLGNAHLKPEQIERPSEAQDASAAATPKGSSTPYRILLADDDLELARYIASELGRWYRFDIAPNGKEALSALFMQSYDLLITDVAMPEMDGVQLLKEVKNVPRLSDIPVILLTSKSEVDTRLESIKQGANSYLTKPFNMDELHVQIDNLIGYVRRLRGKFSGALDQTDKVKDIEVKGNDDALMERITRVINDHLDDSNFNVESLIAEVGISRAHLHRKLKEITGVSAGDFIRNLRMQQAEKLIRKGEINITQVAYAVGFNNQSHFSTVFRKYYGMTPSDYAARHAGDPPTQ